MGNRKFEFKPKVPKKCVICGKDANGKYYAQTWLNGQYQESFCPWDLCEEHMKVLMKDFPYLLEQDAEDLKNLTRELGDRLKEKKVDDMGQVDCESIAVERFAKVQKRFKVKIAEMIDERELRFGMEDETIMRLEITCVPDEAVRVLKNISNMNGVIQVKESFKKEPDVGDITSLDEKITVLMNGGKTQVDVIGQYWDFGVGGRTVSVRDKAGKQVFTCEWQDVVYIGKRGSVSSVIIGGWSDESKA